MPEKEYIMCCSVSGENSTQVSNGLGGNEALTKTVYTRVEFLHMKHDDFL